MPVLRLVTLRLGPGNFQSLSEGSLIAGVLRLQLRADLLRGMYSWHNGSSQKAYVDMCIHARPSVKSAVCWWQACHSCTSNSSIALRVSPLPRYAEPLRACPFAHLGLRLVQTIASSNAEHQDPSCVDSIFIIL